MKPELIIIEDDLCEQYFLNKILSEKIQLVKYIIKSNIIDGWDYIFQNAYKPQIILLDLNFPGDSGFDLLKKIKFHQETKNLPVIIYTHSTNPQDIYEAYNLGANSYVNKPIGLKSTETTILNIIKYWFDNNVQGQ